MYGWSGWRYKGLPVGDLDNLAQVHDRHPVGDVLDHCQVVRHEEQGQVKLSLELFEQVEYLRLHRDVEADTGSSATTNAGFSMRSGLYRFADAGHR